MKLTDGKKTVSISMMTWENDNLSPDWSQDFFEAGALPYDEESGCFTVPEVDYCIDQARDWKYCRGDFYDDAEYTTPYERCVFVDEYDAPTTTSSQYSAAALYDGGWRATDKEELAAEYGLTEEEADDIAEDLKDMEV